MRITRTSQGLAAIATALLLCAAPAVAQDQGAWGDAASNANPFSAVIEHGQGTGTITLPSIITQGTLMGVLTEEGSATQHLLKATLTSFFPDGTGESMVEMGGVYGSLVEIGEGANPKTAFVEGTWILDTRAGGSVEATILNAPGLGSARELGRISGKFVLHPDGKGGSIDLGRAYDDARGSQPPFDSPLGSAAGGKDPGAAYDDNRGSQSPFDSALGSAAGGKDPGAAYDDNRGSQPPFDSPFGSASGGKDPGAAYNDNRGSQSPFAGALSSAAGDDDKAAIFDTAVERKRTHGRFNTAEDDMDQPPATADQMSGLVGFHFVMLDQ